MFFGFYDHEMYSCSSEKWKDKRKEKKRMTVEERKNMRADEEARAEIIKVHFCFGFESRN